MDLVGEGNDQSTASLLPSHRDGLSRTEDLSIVQRPPFLEDDDGVFRPIYDGGRMNGGTHIGFRGLSSCDLFL